MNNFYDYVQRFLVIVQHLHASTFKNLQPNVKIHLFFGQRNYETVNSSQPLLRFV